MGKFYYQNGWSFERLDDGSVRVEWQDGVVRFDVDPDSWASIVASVTPVGDNAETFSMAEKLHRHDSPLREVKPDPHFTYIVPTEGESHGLA